MRKTALNTTINLIHWRVISLLGCSMLCFSHLMMSQNDLDYILKLTDPTVLQVLKKDKDIAYIKPIFRDLDLYAIRLNGEKNQALSQLSKLKGVAYIHKDIIARARLNPNDPNYPNQWGMEKIQANLAWEISTGGNAPNGDDIVVAVFDEGFQLDHPDYMSNVWKNNAEIPNNGIDDDNNGYVDDYNGWNSTTNDDIHRVINHGTSVAGIIGAVGNNQQQVAGINWKVKMMFTSAGRGEFIILSDIVKAYEYIYTQRKIYNDSKGTRGAYVVVSNYSGGAENLFPEDFPAWCEVYDALGTVGILNVTSAPNDDTNVDVEGDLPSTCPSDYLIVVTNTDRQDNKILRAGYGMTSVDLGAPGDGIFTTSVNGQIDNDFSGASASAPHVAGAISLMYSLICEDAFQQSLSDPRSIAQIMKQALYSGADANNSLEGITSTGKRLNLNNSMKIIDRDIGDCCEISLLSRDISMESCANASDIAVELSVETLDLKGDLIYRLTDGINVLEKRDNTFTGLRSGEYDLEIFDEEQPNCRFAEKLTLEGSTVICPFGEFGIEHLYVNPSGTQLEIFYNISEQQDIKVLIYNSLGQLSYQRVVRPILSATRSHIVDISSFPEAVYFVSIQATANISTKSILVAHQ